MAALRGLPDSERAGKAQKVREATRGRIRDILTPPQQTKYDEMQPAGGGGRGTGRSATSGRVWIVGDDGKPTSVSLGLGISDGSATEVVRGGVKEGQEVIIGAAGGAAGRGPAQGQQPSGPRLRL